MHHHQSPFIHRRRSGSPNIPLHLLNASPVVPGQLRHYSSESQRGVEEPPKKSTKDVDSSSRSEPGSSFASAFGFQSLKGLFYQSDPRNRYSRPRERGPVDSTSTSQSSVAGSGDSVREYYDKPWPSSTASSIGDTSYSVPSSSGQSDQDRVSFSPGSSNAENVQSVENGDVKISKVPNFGLRITKHVGDADRSLSRLGARRMQYARAWNIAGESAGQKSEVEPVIPWGLPQEDSNATDSFAEPSYTLQHERKLDSPGRDSASYRALAKDQPQETETKTVANPQTLTHVNTSGEARMVDVGAKPATKRTAVASARLTFSNPEPFRLIFENTNKKGDVLGLARVAGIMGAKRTSELIPLCHPVPITKVEVDVKLLPPNSDDPMINKSIVTNGAVAIEALVECTGSTGVEMEALTAANIAAMTVFDMCKAADRLMRIQESMVVYKSGGKSGLHGYRNWAGFQGREWFADRGLEYPHFADDHTKKSRGGGTRRRSLNKP